MNVTSTDGTSIHYDVFGTGPTVILAHGSLMEGRSWLEAGYIDALAGFHCVVLDCRGYGASGTPHAPESYRAELYVDDLLTVADAVGAERFAIVGYSWGTIGAWRVAVTDRARVAALVAIGGWHPDLYRFEREVMEKTRIEPMRHIGVAGFCEYMRSEEGPLPEWWAEQVLACDPEAYIAQRYAGSEMTTLPPARVTVPTLLVSGSDEDTARDSLLIAGSLDNGDAVIVEGRGHCQTFIASETVEAVTKFLRTRLA